MRTLIVFAVAFLHTSSGFSQTAPDFHGEWNLDAQRSDIRSLPDPPASFLRIQQSPQNINVFPGRQADPASASIQYPLNGATGKSQVDGLRFSIMTKFEGDALLTNVIVSGPRDYAYTERWTISRDGNILTIIRSLPRANGDIESTLTYRNTNGPAFTSRGPGRPGTETAPMRQPESRLDTVRPEPTTEALAQFDAPVDYIVPAGTRVLLRLTNAINTKRSAPGDHVYLQTVAPIFIDRRLVIPVGSYVDGTVIEAQRAGKVKGKSALNLRFDSVTLPNGVKKDFRARTGSTDGSGSVDRTEGRITGDSNKGGDARTVAQTGAAGAGIGGLAGISSGHSGMGAGIGGAVGALAGLAGVFGSRGPDVTLPVGTSVEMVLDRELAFRPDELRRVY